MKIQIKAIPMIHGEKAKTKPTKRAEENSRIL